MGEANGAATAIGGRLPPGSGVGVGVGFGGPPPVPSSSFLTSLLTILKGNVVKSPPLLSLTTTRTLLVTTGSVGTGAITNLALRFAGSAASMRAKAGPPSTVKVHGSPSRSLAWSRYDRVSPSRTY